MCELLLEQTSTAPLSAPEKAEQRLYIKIKVTLHWHSLTAVLHVHLWLQAPFGLHEDGVGPAGDQRLAHAQWQIKLKSMVISPATD